MGFTGEEAGSGSKAEDPRGFGVWLEQSMALKRGFGVTVFIRRSQKAPENMLKKSLSKGKALEDSFSFFLKGRFDGTH